MLTVESPVVAAFDHGDELLLGSLADQMGWAFESVRLRRIADERALHEERLRQGLEASAAVITAGLTATTPAGAMERMVAETGTRFPWDQVMIILRDHGTLRVLAEHGAAWARGCQIAEGRGVVGHVARTGQPYLAADTATDPLYRDFSGGTTSEMCAPLVLAGRVVGVLNVESVVRHLDGSDLTILTQLAEQMGLVLQNTQLLSAEKETVARLHELDQLKSRLLTIALPRAADASHRRDGVRGGARRTPRGDAGGQGGGVRRRDRPSGERALPHRRSDAACRADRAG